MDVRKGPSPWDWLQPHDARMMGEAIFDPAEQKRWSRAVMLGGLPWMWTVRAKVVRELMFARTAMKQGDRVLMFGESLESCEFQQDIRNAIGSAGEIVAIDITDEARGAYAAGRRGRGGQLATWSFRPYFEEFGDASFDAILILQGVQHSDDWVETAEDLVRIVKPGGPILLAEITFSPAMVMKADSDLHLSYWTEKLFAAIGWSFEDFPYYSPRQLIEAFDAEADLDFELEWKGVEIELFRRLV